MKKLSQLTRISISLILILLIFGIFPLFLLHYNSNENKNLLQLSTTVEQLEKENNALIAEIKKVESNRKIASKPSAVSHATEKITIIDTKAENAGVVETIEKIPITDPKRQIEFLPGPITYNTPTSSVAKSVLVVGGTDGSGTRRVVQILTELGVTMVSEDSETYDIHANIVGGWPPVVNPVIECTKSLYYSPETLPGQIRTPITIQLKKLLDLVESNSHKPTSHTLGVGGVLKKPGNIEAKNIRYGFKAPVAMTLAPFWALLLNDFRMLHVIRDGRDIAFSANQGPVQKFYAAMYNPSENFINERAELKAIRLWSNWNAALKKWAEDHVTKFSNDRANINKTFGYYALHSEDLVDDDKNIRFAALANLADWLGSDITDKALCCLAMKGTEFMGSHDRTDMKAKDANKLTSRYGKWKNLLRLDPGLRSGIFTIGSTALKEFGYEPMRNVLYKDQKTKDERGSSIFKMLNGKSCDILPSDCGFLPSNIAPKDRIDAIKIESWGVPGLCNVMKGIDYRGGDLTVQSMTLEGGIDSTQCCRTCQSTPFCKHFTIDLINNLCYLKSNTVQALRTGMTVSLISGDMIMK